MATASWLMLLMVINNLSMDFTVTQNLKFENGANQLPHAAQNQGSAHIELHVAVGSRQFQISNVMSP